MRLSLNTILFNAAGLGVLLFVGGYMANSFFYTEEVPVCHARYGGGVRFPLVDPSGRKLSSIELQARVPTREWGLLTHARVVETQDRKAQFLQVALGPAAGSDTSADEEDAKLHDGVGFVWAPTGLNGTRAACLTYRLFLPKDFSFDVPGKLPGLYATREIEDLDRAVPQSGFVSRLAWQKGGGLGAVLRTPNAPDAWLGSRNQGWPLGRWVDVAQEVALGVPGKSNGLMRVWIDGQLRVERTGLDLTANNQDALSGVVADLGYDEPTGSPGRLTISSFVIQRQ